MKNRIFRSALIAAPLVLAAAGAVAQTINPYPIERPAGFEAPRVGAEAGRAPAPLFEPDAPSEESLQAPVPETGQENQARREKPAAAEINTQQWLNEGDRQNSGGFAARMTDSDPLNIEAVHVQSLGAGAPAMPVDAALEEITPAPAPMSAFAPESAPSYGWGAKKGEDIRNVLGRWSQQAGVVLVWNTQNQFEVLEPQSGGGSYESAVTALLAQYKGSQIRPYGVLYMDPANGERVLSIDSGSGG